MVSVGGPKGGRKSLDAEINLVPFIDLLSMCICFLLMTAVWIQMQVVQVKQSHGVEAPNPSSPFDLKLNFTGPTTLDLIIEKAGKAVKTLPLGGQTREALVSQLDAALNAIISPADPAAATLINAAVITPSAQAPYSHLISVMDTLRQHQVVNLGVIPKGN